MKRVNEMCVIEKSPYGYPPGKKDPSSETKAVGRRMDVLAYELKVISKRILSEWNTLEFEDIDQVSNIGKKLEEMAHHLRAAVDGKSHDYPFYK